MLELMTDEPPVVQRLQVVPGRRLAVTWRAAGEKVRPRVENRGPRRGDSGGEVERAGERYEARAAASNASKSGTSEVS